MQVTEQVTKRTHSHLFFSFLSHFYPLIVTFCYLFVTSFKNNYYICIGNK